MSDYKIIGSCWFCFWLRLVKYWKNWLNFRSWWSWLVISWIETRLSSEMMCAFSSASQVGLHACVLWIMFFREDSHLNSDVCVQERRQTACWLCATVKREVPWRWASPTPWAAPSPEKQTVVFTSMLVQRLVWLAPRWVYFFLFILIFLIYQVILLLRDGDTKWQPHFNIIFF